MVQVAHSNSDVYASFSVMGHHLRHSDCAFVPVVGACQSLDQRFRRRVNSVPDLHDLLPFHPCRFGNLAKSRVGSDYLLGCHVQHRSDAIRSCAHRWRKPGSDGMAYHFARDSERDHHAVHPEFGTYIGCRLRSNLHPLQPAGLSGGRYYRYLGIPDRTPPIEFQSGGSSRIV